MIGRSDDCELDSIEFSVITDDKQPTLTRLELYTKADNAWYKREDPNPDKAPQHHSVSIPYCIRADHEDHLRYKNPKGCEWACNERKLTALDSTGFVQEPVDGDRRIDQGQVAIQCEQQ